MVTLGQLNEIAAMLSEHDSADDDETLRVAVQSMAKLLAELYHLRRQVTELQAHNTARQERARAAAQDREETRAALAVETKNANAYAHERDDARAECERMRLERDEVRKQRDEARVIAERATRSYEKQSKERTEFAIGIGHALGWTRDESVECAARRVVKERDEARAALAMYSGDALDDYQRDAMRTTIHARGEAGELALTWNALGIAGEAGEVADIIKKHVGHGHELDRAKLTRELGDVLWYVAALAHDIGVDLSTVARENVEKLKTRYPDGFSQERSINRGAT